MHDLPPMSRGHGRSINIVVDSSAKVSVNNLGRYSFVSYGDRIDESQHFHSSIGQPSMSNWVCYLGNIDKLRYKSTHDSPDCFILLEDLSASQTVRISLNLSAASIGEKSGTSSDIPNMIYLACSSTRLNSGASPFQLKTSLAHC